eukprot:gene13356-9188_t
MVKQKFSLKDKQKRQHILIIKQMNYISISIYIYIYIYIYKRRITYASSIKYYFYKATAFAISLMRCQRVPLVCLCSETAIASLTEISGLKIISGTIRNK